MKSPSVTPTSDVFCVVRAAGERTRDACKFLLEDQLGSEVQVIEGLPFREVLRSCFVKTLASAKPLLLTCDADVLPYKGAITELLRLDSRVPSNYFQIVCEVDDYLFGHHRNGGMRLYRAAWLNDALNFISGSDGDRPESGLIRPMAEIGHPSAFGSSVIGLHDSEQYFRDVFRKAVFFSHKHEGSLGKLVNYWRNDLSKAPEAPIALYGLAEGLLRANPGPDVSQFDSAHWLNSSEGFIEEREPLARREIENLSVSMPSVSTRQQWHTFPSPTGIRSLWLESRRQSQPFLFRLLEKVLNRLLRFVVGFTSG